MTDYHMIMRRTGGPEVIERESLDLRPPDAGEVLVRQDAVGLNFIDTYRRSGLYPVELPAEIGCEAAGRVEAVGADVQDFRVGDRVGYATGPLGAYATARLIAADQLIALPEAVGDEMAAAGLLKGMTAAFLSEQCAQVQPGQAVLVHAAAGGVGSILVQWLTAIGATVIAHAGSAAKGASAKALGATHALSGPMDTLADEVRDLTNGAGAAVIFDGVGAASWTASLGAIGKRGMLVSYGNASGPVPPFDALALMRAGSIFVTRPTLFDYASTAEERRALAARLFAMMTEHGLTIPIGQRFKLEDAAEAHRRLEARETEGATVLLPG